MRRRAVLYHASPDDATVSALTVKFAAVEETSTKKLEKMNLPSSGTPDQAGTRGVPAKYARIASSVPKTEVKPQANKYDIELKD